MISHFFPGVGRAACALWWGVWLMVNGVALGLGGVSLQAQEGKSGQVHVLTLDLDKVLELPGLWELTPKMLEERCPAEGFSKNPYFRWASEQNSGKHFAFFSSKPFTNVRVNASLFGGKVKIETMVLEFKADKVASALVILREPEFAEFGGVAEVGETCETALEKACGAKPVEEARYYGSSATKTFRTKSFAGANGTACLDVSESRRLLRFTLAPPGTSPSALLAQPLVELDRNATQWFCHLDGILKFPQLWELTPKALEEAFGANGPEDTVIFQWLNSERTAARFARQPYSNISIDLRLFKSQAPIQEAVLHFKGGKLSSVAVSIYNRGDSGQISQEDFDALFKKTGLELIERLGARPVEHRPRAPTAVKTKSWLWNTPHTLALLEYNQEAMTKKAAAEFLRLRMAPVSEKDELLNIAAIGQSTTTLGRGELPQFVKKEANGDVYVSSIPMVDQGAKGYCVVASCERLFGYLNVPVDQHELASIAGSEADRGTNAQAFVEALKKINTRFKVRFKPLLEKMPLMPSEEREARPDRFAKMIQEQVDRGVPLLWALQLGLFPEEPNIAQQSGGGHMRLIIGYNGEKKEILFSDSWGAGHELKRMKLEDAVQATIGVYLVEPKGR